MLFAYGARAGALQRSDLAAYLLYPFDLLETRGMSETVLSRRRRAFFSVQLQDNNSETRTESSANHPH